MPGSPQRNTTEYPSISVLCCRPVFLLLVYTYLNLATQTFSTLSGFNVWRLLGRTFLLHKSLHYILAMLTSFW